MSDSESFASAKEVESDAFDNLKDEESDYEPAAKSKKKSTPKKPKTSKKKVAKAEPKSKKGVKSPGKKGNVSFKLESDDESEEKPVRKTGRGRPKKTAVEVESSGDEVLAKKSPKKGRGRPPAKKANGIKSKSSPVDPLACSEGSEESEEEVKPKKGKGKAKAKAPSDSEEEYEVESIVGHREYSGSLMYKIRWKNYGPKDDTWEEHNKLCCPDILERYNIKHKVNVRSSSKKGSPKKASGKGKAKGRGRPKGVKKPKPKKRRSSESEDEVSEMSLDLSDGASEKSGVNDYEVSKILHSRTKEDNTREFLVRWKGWAPEFDSWEPEANLECPDLISEFHVREENGENDEVGKPARELRHAPKQSKKLDLSDRFGRRASKRSAVQQVKYDEDEDEDEEAVVESVEEPAAKVAKVSGDEDDQPVLSEVVEASA